MRAALMIACALAGGCLRKTAFVCAADGDCGAGGTCQSDVGFCSFLDASCASGSRFGELSGALANQCVGAIDDPRPDAAEPIDGPPPAACPADYVTIPNASHHYRFINTLAVWETQRVACAADAGGYLAIPGDAAEVAAIEAFVANATLWIGISDLETEDTFVDVRGATATFLPFAAGEPDSNPGFGDCLAMSGPALRFFDDDCQVVPLAGALHRAVCECDLP
jgi:hypothetical protein